MPCSPLGDIRSNITKSRPRELVDYEHVRAAISSPADTQDTPIRSGAMCSDGSAPSGAVSTTAAGIPILGYLLSPVLRTPANQWIDLGPIDAFPQKQTRLIDFVDPLHRPWDGDAQRLAAYVRRTGRRSFRFSR